MTDAFAEFGFERRPWLDPAALLSRYHELAADRHPDKRGDDPLALARLNEARRILTSTPLRLRHLLALHAPPGITAGKFHPDFELFSCVGTLAKRAEQHSGKIPHAAPALTAALAGAESEALQMEISTTLDRINLQIHALEEKLRSLDAIWPDANPRSLFEIAEEYSYLNRWQESLRSSRTLLLGG